MLSCFLLVCHSDAEAGEQQVYWDSSAPPPPLLKHSSSSSSPPIALGVLGYCLHVIQPPLQIMLASTFPPC